MTIGAHRNFRLMSNKRWVIIPAALLVLIGMMTGCSPDRSGTSLQNQPPRVYIVNTPPDGAQFSRNPDLDWYATDIDGFIKFFRYAVVVESLLVINGQQVSVEQFIVDAVDDQFGWETLFVTLDNPQSSATVRLYANIDFPVDSFVNQYFFVQAQDDKQAMSETVWRRYSRNNHYPNTHHRSNRVYINAVDEDSPAPGVQLVWSGADSTDWGRAVPPLEFEWRLYGPFSDTAKIFVNIVKENCIWDPSADSFTNCVNVQVLDLDALPPVVGDLPQPLARSMGPEYEKDPTDVWVTDEQVTIYNVFKDLDELTRTTQFKFIFWVRARDDGFVPDPSPAFGQFLVLEALFERDIAVHDETYYTQRAGRWHPNSIFLVKDVFQNYINNTLDKIYDGDYLPFDTFSRFDEYVVDGIFPPDSVSDFFSITTRPDRVTPGDWGPAFPNLVDLLSHKIHFFFNDDAAHGPEENLTFGLLGHIYFAMEMGASGWFMGRNLAKGDHNVPGGYYDLVAREMPGFPDHFGLTSVYHEGWFFQSMGRVVRHLLPIWNQEYIGCLSLVPEIFPDVSIDLNLLASRYITIDSIRFYEPVNDTLHFDAFPEIGSGTRAGNAAAIYLYQSKDGSISRLNGQVMGVAMELPDSRAATMLFTPIATDSVETQELFDRVMPWLMDKWLNPASAAKVVPGVFAKGTSGYDLDKRHQYINDYFQRIEEEAKDHPELLRKLNIVLEPPIVIDKQ